jgi:hypothetical protein
VNAYTLGSILFVLRLAELLLSFLLCRHVDDDLHKPKVKMRRNSGTKLLFTFNVVGLSPCFNQEGQESRTTPFEEGEDDEDIPGSPHLSSSPHHKSQLSNEAATKKTYLGPMTRSRAKHIEQEVNALLANHTSTIHENFILPKSSVLILLRYNVEDNQQLSAHEETSSAHEETSSEAHTTSLKRTSFNSDVNHVLVTRATNYASRKNSKPSQQSIVACTVPEFVPELAASCNTNI